ncbi:MAG: tryptophan--tRNA ligase [Chloroflexi bacterium]|nr:tryptophan--tRNA ligase [Chloroflexota bacterium]
MCAQKKGRVFSGARPTGRQHIGNYLGAIKNYVALQDEYDCIYCAVDIHALTTLENTDKLQENIQEMMLDWLAAGLDPQRSILFVQSHVPEVMVLHTLLSMVTPYSWLTRVPSFKEKARQQPENINYGLLGYPVLMTADIVIYKADTVPVGEDQLAHLELAREIVRRFNHLFSPTFPEPQPKLTQAPLIVGLDGSQKMSKSLNNHIELAATPEETHKRVMTAMTDPQRQRKTDPGRPEVCNVYSLHQQFNPDKLDDIAYKCRNALRGCVECKGMLADGINRELKPFRERRQGLVERPGYVKEVLADGAQRASVIARETLLEVEEKMGLKAKA